ncbi:GNAT family N-acetyltransferase [Brucella pseudogrignonensis]|jgi:RimJ/RimL family protein N-acetyltransferase
MISRSSLEGIAYRIRPIAVADAAFVVSVRLEDQERNKYINPISSDLGAQERWIADYLKRNDDFYFVIENRLTGEAEGLIAIYDLKDGAAEWGRWVLRKGSLAAVESVDLIFKMAFKTLKLKELYCRTIADNTPVVSFHDALPQNRRGIHEAFVTLNGQNFDVVEHLMTTENYFSSVEERLAEKIMPLFLRNFRASLGKLEFHHIGVATKSIASEMAALRVLGYRSETEEFEDTEQGIRGKFIVAQGQPRLELLENLPGHKTLDVWLERGVKMYHFAYKTEEFDKLISFFNKGRIRPVGTPKVSAFFGKRICFLALTNAYLIELIEV